MILSIVIPCLGDVAPSLRCLEALVPQKQGEPVEIIVVDREGQGSAIATRFPGVRVIASLASSIPVLRAEGMAACRGEVIAFLNESYVPQAGWLTAALRAIEAGQSSFGGPVDLDPGAGWIERGVYLFEYAAFMLPRATGSVRVLPGGNAAYRRQAIEGIDLARWEWQIQRDLLRRGVTLHMEPLMTVHVCRRASLLASLRDRHCFSRAFAAARLQGSSSPYRIAYAIAAGLLPPLLCGRTIARAVRGGRSRMLIGSLPIVVALSMAASVGEACGALFGDGGSEGEMR